MYFIEKLKKCVGLKHFFSTIDDGNMSFKYGEESEVQSNRLSFFKRCRVVPDNVVVMVSKEVTGNINIVSSKDAFSGVNNGNGGIIADALITNEKNLSLFFVFADCLPLIMFDYVKGVVALAHCGTKWSDNLTAIKTLDKMISIFHCNVNDMIFGFGPCIKKRSYEYDYFNPVSLKYWANCVTPNQYGKINIDIVKCNVNQLIANGAKKDRIYISKIDTFVNRNFYSHVRSLKYGEPEGRFACIVGLV